MLEIIQDKIKNQNHLGETVHVFGQLAPVYLSAFHGYLEPTEPKR